MFGNLSGPTLLVILFIVLLLFGAPKLPGLAKSLGQSMRILKKEVRTDNEESSTSEASNTQAQNTQAPRNTTTGTTAAPQAPSDPPRSDTP